MRFGKTLLILEVDGVEPMLYPLCRKDLCHQGPRFVVTVGDKVVDYNENFRMYLVTRNPEPDIPPDAAGLVTQVWPALCLSSGIFVRELSCSTIFWISRGYLWQESLLILVYM